MGIGGQRYRSINKLVELLGNRKARSSGVAAIKFWYPVFFKNPRFEDTVVPPAVTFTLLLVISHAFINITCACGVDGPELLEHDADVITAAAKKE